MEEKIRRMIQHICDIIESCIAIAVGAGLVISLLLYIPEGAALLTGSSEAGSFLQFLEDMFSFIVGVEFIKMLCRPNAESVIEVLVFLVARHMIIESDTSFGILLSVIAVILLYACRQMLRWSRRHLLRGEQEPEAPEEKRTDG